MHSEDRDRIYCQYLGIPEQSIFDAAGALIWIGCGTAAITEPAFSSSE